MAGGAPHAVTSHAVTGMPLHGGRRAFVATIAAPLRRRRVFTDDDGLARRGARQRVARTGCASRLGDCRRRRLRHPRAAAGTHRRRAGPLPLRAFHECESTSCRGLEAAGGIGADPRQRRHGWHGRHRRPAPLARSVPAAFFSRAALCRRAARPALPAPTRNARRRCQPRLKRIVRACSGENYKPLSVRCQNYMHADVAVRRPGRAARRHWHVGASPEGPLVPRSRFFVIVPQSWLGAC